MWRQVFRYLTGRRRQTRALFLLECQIHGSHYYDCLKLIKSEQLSVGELLRLRRQPDNEYDKYAIEILTRNGQKLGYVPQKDNRVIAALIDQGCHVTAHIELIVSTAWEPVTIRIMMGRFAVVSTTKQPRPY